MEFNEKLQRCRKLSGLTQEQLAERLNISRTAVSKWESGRGFPNIEALKNLSKVFQVPIDDLLSGEELIGIAERDGADGLDKAYSRIFGILDLLSLAFILLPFYGNDEGDYIRAVNLFRYVTLPSIKAIYFGLFALLGLVGALEIAAQFSEGAKARLLARRASLVLHALAILFFTMTREPYVAFFSILLILSKGLLLLRKSR
ncbi:helix-turn-helix domain-containing protein [bacterium]|nr:helix-turn-helix domain-containing protein [bacterium]